MGQPSWFYCPDCKKLRLGLTKKAYLADTKKLRGRGASFLLEGERYKQAMKKYFAQVELYERLEREHATAKELRAACPTGGWLEKSVPEIGNSRRGRISDGRTGRRYIERFNRDRMRQASPVGQPPTGLPITPRALPNEVDWDKKILAFLNATFKAMPKKVNTFYGPNRSAYFFRASTDANGELRLLFCSPSESLKGDLVTNGHGHYLDRTSIEDPIDTIIRHARERHQAR